MKNKTSDELGQDYLDAWDAAWDAWDAAAWDAAAWDAVRVAWQIYKAKRKEEENEEQDK